ncbi:MAG: LysM peptidoglycan-binding domain-containing protein [Bacilli bacterium]|nr:LysM peptidoglycan-binding domain-containing protein [Bacilli bacterium]
MVKKGIDISKYQKDIDWQKVKDDGIEFAIIRIGYGKYDNQKDPYFEKNYEGARKAGIPVGVYHYSYATSIDEAKLEAGCVLCWLHERKLDLPVYFDIEDKCQFSLSKKTLTDICKAFCNRIEEAGYWAGIYASKHWSNNLIDGASLGKRYTYWVAQYNSKCTYTGPYDMWQYSSSGRVNGINGNVDMNYMYRDLVSAVSGKQVVQTNKKSANEIAKEVIAGKWGNGQTRKTKLTQAGYNYSEIQTIVNNLTNIPRKPKTTLQTVYVVKRGDTLSSIAKKYGTTWQKIYANNKSIIGNNPNIIKIGLKLIIKK